jgi:diaminopimelate decarboxylase
MENGEALSALEKIQGDPNISLTGLHTHLYGDTDDVDMYGLAAERLGEFAKQHVTDYPRSRKAVRPGIRRKSMPIFAPSQIA